MNNGLLLNIAISSPYLKRRFIHIHCKPHNHVELFFSIALSFKQSSNMTVRNDPAPFGTLCASRFRALCHPWVYRTAYCLSPGKSPLHCPYFSTPPQLNRPAKISSKSSTMQYNDSGIITAAQSSPVRVPWNSESALAKVSVWSLSHDGLRPICFGKDKNCLLCSGPRGDITLDKFSWKRSLCTVHFSPPSLTYLLFLSYSRSHRLSLGPSFPSLLKNASPGAAQLWL